MNNTAIILAGGIGMRMQISTPKQFLEFNNKMIVEYSIDKFLQNKLINDIIVVCNKEWIEKLKIKYSDLKIVNGGSNRLNSSYNGLLACNKNTKNVLIHDAVRPFVSNKTINISIENLNNYDATIPTISCIDSMIDENTMNYIKRENIKIIQTPQGFNYNIILNAYKKHKSIKQRIEANFKDDFSLLLYYHPNINYFFYKGDNSNYKITNKEDLKKIDFKC